MQAQSIHHEMEEPCTRQVCLRCCMCAALHQNTTALLADAMHRLSAYSVREFYVKKGETEERPVRAAVRPPLLAALRLHYECTRTA
jgi:hypothetical protein